MINCPKCNSSEFIGINAVVTVRGEGYINVNNQTVIEYPDEYELVKADVKGEKLICFECFHDWEVQS